MQAGREFGDATSPLRRARRLAAVVAASAVIALAAPAGAATRASSDAVSPASVGLSAAATSGPSGTGAGPGGPGAGPSGTGADSRPGVAQPESRTWTLNLYRDDAIRWQNPDPRACTAAAALSMLNLIAYSTAEVMPLRGGELPTVAFRWHADISYDAQEQVLAYERDNDTLLPWEPGSDPHGWRNALNYYGWGSLHAGVYWDRTFGTFDSAAYFSVRALARTGKPVGILAWNGGHAEFITGYVVSGEDPRISDDFHVVGVYLTDPYEFDGTRNLLVSYQSWRYGPLTMRFNQYWQMESPYRDPIDGHIGNREWRGKWVIEEPTV